jgi:hypothetical protein
LERVDLPFTGRKSACFTSNSGIFCLYWGLNLKGKELTMPWQLILTAIIAVSAVIIDALNDED